jgi:dipeptidase E
MRLLLLSNSMNAGSGYLEHAADWLAEHFAGVGTVAFVPYAAVRFGYDEYEERVARALAHTGAAVRSVHRDADPASAVRSSDAVAVGGGNTFHLAHEMQRLGLVEAIRERARRGAPYAGWSAGANVASPTLRTTNDMPIIEPRSFDVLGLVPFQVNPHYLDAHPDGHMGETREERLLEFVRVNPDVFVIGLREGSALRLDEGSADLLGPRTARIFRGDAAPYEVEPGTSLDFLLR